MAGDPPNWTDILSGLPPQLQPILVLGVGLAVGYVVVRKYMQQSKGEGPQATEFAVGGPTAFADMSGVKKLVENVDHLTIQMMKSSTSGDSVASRIATATEALADVAIHMAKLCDLVGQLLIDLREQREEEEIESARQRGYEEGRRDSDAKRRQQPSTRRVPTK